MRMLFFFTLLVLLVLLALASLAGRAAGLSSGPGLGVMYGGAGINVEYHATPAFSVAAGVNPFTSELRWTTAGILHPAPETPLRFSAGLTNTFDLFSGGNRDTRGFLGVGWAPTRRDGYRGWTFDFIFGENKRSASVGYSF